MKMRKKKIIKKLENKGKTCVFKDHQTLGGFPKVKEGSSRGFDGK